MGKLAGEQEQHLVAKGCRNALVQSSAPPSLIIFPLRWARFEYKTYVLRILISKQATCFFTVYINSLEVGRKPILINDTVM